MGEFLLLLVGMLVVCCVTWLFVSRGKQTRALAHRGHAALATVTDVRDDRSDMQTIVTYRFEHGGASFERTGVLRRDQLMPVEGSKIAIVFVPDNPKVSRLKLEE
jgi:hypothetical protein